MNPVEIVRKQYQNARVCGIVEAFKQGVGWVQVCMDLTTSSLLKLKNEGYGNVNIKLLEVGDVNYGYPDYRISEFEECFEPEPTHGKLWVNNGYRLYEKVAENDGWVLIKYKMPAGKTYYRQYWADAGIDHARAIGYQTIINSKRWTGVDPVKN